MPQYTNTYKSKFQIIPIPKNNNTTYGPQLLSCRHLLDRYEVSSFARLAPTPVTEKNIQSHDQKTHIKYKLLDTCKLLKITHHGISLRFFSDGQVFAVININLCILSKNLSKAKVTSIVCAPEARLTSLTPVQSFSSQLQQQPIIIIL